MKICRLGGLLLLLFCMHTTVYAQQVRTVRGRVQMLETGSERKQSLPSASIVVLEKMDSAFVKGTASDKNGRFTLTYQPQKKKEYLLKVSFMGMQSFYRALGDSVSINAGTIVLKDDDLQIDEVVVTGKLREVVMEGDTTVINASAYKTPEGAYLEDLVKRIPGVYSPIPMGAFYTVAKLPVDDSDKFCAWCLSDFEYEGQTVFMAPASGFYTTPGSGINEVRIAYVLKKEDLTRALFVLQKALEVYPGRTE